MKIWKSLNNSFFNEDLRTVYKMKGGAGGGGGGGGGENI